MFRFFEAASQARAWAGECTSSLPDTQVEVARLDVALDLALIDGHGDEVGSAVLVRHAIGLTAHVDAPHGRDQVHVHGLKRARPRFAGSTSMVTVSWPGWSGTAFRAFYGGYRHAADVSGGQVMYDPSGKSNLPTDRQVKVERRVPVAVAAQVRDRPSRSPCG